ncbi:MAG: hypothetical protein IH784_06360 [Bacteroidetes bacterium]|nr:hypothetical protein [Bacteroidota bacterium]
MVLPWLKDGLNPYEILFVLWSAFSRHHTILEGFKPPTVKPLLFLANFMPLDALSKTEMYHKKD